ncbi:MAG: Glycosidase [Oscillospiraceae bacterium]|jgi:beta-1,2-mannobiose phosphorylase / 1,2-beta-oligomannan phosphorylase
MIKYRNNPIIAKEDVNPSQSNLKVDGVFNCGVCKYQDEILLLCRVSESAASSQGDINVPVMNMGNNKIHIVTVKNDKSLNLDFSDPRVITMNTNSGPKIKYLTSFSHLRLARSKDGYHFTIDEKPFIWPGTEEESWGIEDPRITQIGNTYYICYTAVSRSGPAVGLISTEDFKEYKRHGIIFAPDNKDTVIFPEKIGGMYYALNRPCSGEFNSRDMWISESPDLIHWGNQKHFCSTSNEGWECERIGAGAVPFKTEKGWIEIYHAANEQGRYCLGAMLLDKMQPWKMIAKTKEPILEPTKPYETNGYFGNAVFSCGCYVQNENVIIYYGAADDKICRADISLKEIFDALCF